MYGQMTAGSWIYIGTQGILQGTYECFAEIARRRFGGSLAGTITVTAGLGGMGGAQPLAVTMNGGVALCIDVDPTRHPAAHRDPLPRRAWPTSRRRDRALRAAPRPSGGASTSAWSATRPRSLPRLLARGFEADIVTDQTSAHDPLGATCPTGCRSRRPTELRARRPGRVRPPRRAPRWPRTARRWSASWTRGAEVFDYGNSLRAEARARRLRARVRLPRLRARLHPAAVLRGQGPVPLGRAVRRSRRHRGDRPRGARGVPRRRARSARWIRLAGERIAFQGLPARICWLGYGERRAARAALQRDGAQRAS